MAAAHRFTPLLNFNCMVMFESPTSPDAPAARSAPSSEIARAWLIAITAWCLSGALAVLGFSLGLSLVRPPQTNGAQRTWREAVTWMDGRWYKQIATGGYQYNPKARSNIAFFPVYPLLSSAVMAFIGSDAEIALLMVSNVSFLAALVVLAFYVRQRYPNAPCEIGDCAVVAAVLFPTGCFFRLAYSESTFLLLTLLAMYAMLRRWRLWEIAFLVGLATAARPVGIALLAPFAIHLVRRTRDENVIGPLTAGDAASTVENANATNECRRAAARRRILPCWFPRALCRLLVFLPLSCWGLAEFLAYQALVFDEPLATANVQIHWRIRHAASWHEKAAALAMLEPVWSVYDPRSPAFWRNRDPHGARLFSLQFATPILFAAAIALLAVGFMVRNRNGHRIARRGDAARRSSRWLSLEEAALAAVLLLIPYVTRAYEMGFGSMGRFAAVVFPLYLVLGHLLARIPLAASCVLLAFSGLFLTTYMALYAAGYAIF